MTETDISALRAAALKATKLNLNTAQLVCDNSGMEHECPLCEGNGTVDGDVDYCNIDSVALGVQFYGIGPEHGLAESYFRAATPETILSLLDQVEAERQRAAIIEQTSQMRLERAEKAEQALESECDIHIDTQQSMREWKSRAEKAEAEIAALKSKLALKTEKLADCESALAKSEKSNAFLKEELDQLANFNPDWDMLEACRESWREVVALLKERNAELAELKQNVLVMPDGLHRDTKALLLVFASAMAVKLHKAEQRYGFSNTWMQNDWQDKCLADFNHHITKGDPLDVANYCAFMWHHGWPTAPKPSVKGE